MAIMIREFLQGKVSAIEKVSDAVSKINVTEALHGNPDLVDSIDPNSLMVEIEGLHAIPFVTGNDTRYTAEALKNSVPTWTIPYRRPLLKHHNEDDGEPIGRVISAEYVTTGTRSGTPALRFLVNVPDKDAIESIKNGLLMTVSVGGIASDVRCSICGSPIIDPKEGCPEGHKKGASYRTENGLETCYWDINELFAKELSFVDVPSDMYAKTLDYYPASERGSRKKAHIKESLKNNNAIGKGENAMEKELKAANEKVAALEAQVVELTEAKKASEDKVTELTASIDTLNKKVSELEKSNTDLTTAAGDLNEKIAGLEEANAKLSEAVKEAEQLKESMEKEISETKIKLKESMVDTFSILRDVTGNKVIDVAAIKDRSMDSLADSIMDMKESLAASKKGIDVQESQKTAPGATEDEPKEIKDLNGAVKQPTGEIEVKESVSTEAAIDLKAGFQNIFSSILSSRC